MEPLKPQDLKAFYAPKPRLRLTVRDERSYPTVVPAWSAPLTRPGKYLSLLDGKGKEIALVADPNDLDAESRTAVLEEVERRYLTSYVTAIVEARVEFGATYWSVETDRGHRDLVTQSLQENAQWLGEHQLLLVDVDGNRFEIKDIRQLDARSRKLLDSIV